MHFNCKLKQIIKAFALRLGLSDRVAPDVSIDVSVVYRACRPLTRLTFRVASQGQHMYPGTRSLPPQARQSGLPQMECCR